MKPLLILPILGATSLLAQSPARVTTATLDESEVRITYGELKRLLAPALPKDAPPETKPKPPVQAALLSGIYHLELKSAAIIADLLVESFDNDWHLIPLAGASSGAVAIEPKDARIVVSEDHLCLITDKAGTQNLKLTFPLAQESQATTLHLAASPVASLQLQELPEGKILRIQHSSMTRTLRSTGTAALPATGGTVTLTLEDARTAAPPLAGSATDDAVLTSATYTTQVVRDGSILTEGTLLVRHDHPAQLALQLPEASRLLQCHVNGAVVRPAPGAAGRIDIPLDDPATDGAESEVRLSFTATLAALHTAEGELDLALPQTPLFAKQIDWNVQLPPAYDLSFTGNVDPITDKATAPGLHLRKSLCRDQQPQARITYRKRTTN